MPVVDEKGAIKAIFTQGDFVSYTWPDLIYQMSQMTKASLTKHFNLTSILIMIMVYSIAIRYIFMKLFEFRTTKVEHIDN